MGAVGADAAVGTVSVAYAFVGAASDSASVADTLGGNGAFGAAYAAGLVALWLAVDGFGERVCHI